MFCKFFFNNLSQVWVPRAAWHQRVMSSTVSPGNQVASWSIQTLPLHAVPCKGGSYTSLADRGDNMERNVLDKSMREGLFRRKLDVTVVSVWRETAKTLLVRDTSDCDETHFNDWGNGSKDGWIFQDKKNMFLTIREGIAEVLHELKQLRKDTEYTEDWAKSL